MARAASPGCLSNVRTDPASPETASARCRGIGGPSRETPSTERNLSASLWVAGRRRLLRVYAMLEVGIGLSALGVMTMLPLLTSAYPRIASAASSGTLLAVARFVLVFGLLLVPTSLMGGTFPILVKAATRE